MKAKQIIKDEVKAIVIILMAMASIVLLFGIEEEGAMSEVRFVGAIALGGTAYHLANKWLQDEKDEKDGVTQSAKDEMEA